MNIERSLKKENRKIDTKPKLSKRTWTKPKMQRDLYNSRNIITIVEIRKYVSFNQSQKYRFKVRRKNLRDMPRHVD